MLVYAFLEKGTSRLQVVVYSLDNIKALPFLVGRRREGVGRDPLPSGNG